jgi:Ca-activated chloride channel family protein
VTYDHLLARDGERIDYLLPRSESIGYDVPWTITVQVQSTRELATLYSPSHDVETVRGASNRVSAKLTGAAASEPGPFRLSYLLAGDGPTASLFAYPDATGGGGTFLLLTGLPAPGSEPGAAALRREVTVVLDCSGSMGGDKLDQARTAAQQVLEGLDDGESFNVLVYSDQVSMFSRQPVAKDADTIRRAREYLASVRAGGGTNIHEALTRALSQDATEGALPMVLFLTDGLPTVGITSEAAIGEQVVEANPHERRVFAFGVGYDVNAPLLDRLASETRGTATYVQPEQDVVPGRLPDLFEGDQLVVLGRYVGEEPLNFVLGGSYRGRPRSFEFEFPLDGATTDNSFVPRLWASRRIAALTEEIRQSGATRGTPRVTELVDEIVDLSSEYGILTEYTAFLALEGTDLSRRDDVLAQAAANFQTRAVGTRSGIGAVNQSMNQDFQVTQSRLNVRNEFYDAQMNRVEVTDVQQVNDRAFFRRGSRWVDSRLARAEAADPAIVIEFGSNEHLELVRRLAAEGRAGSVSLGGEILLQVDGEPVLIRGNPSGDGRRAGPRGLRGPRGRRRPLGDEQGADRAHRPAAAGPGAAPPRGAGDPGRGPDIAPHPSGDRDHGQRRRG